MCDRKNLSFFIYQSRSFSLSVKTTTGGKLLLCAKIYEKKLLEKKTFSLKNKILFITFKNNHFVSFVFEF
jgi:hypothetical protein